MSDSRDPYEQTDWHRRRQPRWLRRGLVFALLARRGGQVDRQTYEGLVHAAGYTDLGAVGGFLRGDPEPVIERDGDEFSLTSRGQWAARFWDQYWLPRLRAGTDQWPTREARRIIEGA